MYCPYSSCYLAYAKILAMTLVSMLIVERELYFYSFFFYKEAICVKMLVFIFDNGREILIFTVKVFRYSEFI